MEFWILFIIVCWLVSSYKYHTSNFKGEDRTEHFVDSDRTEPKPIYKPDPRRQEKINRFLSAYNSNSSINKHTTNLVNPMQYSNQFCSAETKLEYMQSTEWMELKQTRLDIADHCCEVEGCNEIANLQLHHVTYERLLAEDIEDVRIVCSKHHNLIHQQLGYDRTTIYPIN